MDVNVEFLVAKNWDEAMPERMRWLRENDPVHWSEKDQLWLVAKFDDVTAVSKDRAVPAPPPTAAPIAAPVPGLPAMAPPTAPRAAPIAAPPMAFLATVPPVLSFPTPVSARYMQPAMSICAFSSPTS